ncbi:MAG: hypothetical protein LH629_15400, partial [Ignavibacteria bacterium]|nr:hypothetical protein [Ignavibacteria bacterium]
GLVPLLYISLIDVCVYLDSLYIIPTTKSIHTTKYYYEINRIRKEKAELMFISFIREVFYEERKRKRKEEKDNTITH